MPLAASARSSARTDERVARYDGGSGPRPARGDSDGGAAGALRPLASAGAAVVARRTSTRARQGGGARRSVTGVVGTDASAVASVTPAGAPRLGAGDRLR